MPAQLLLSCSVLQPNYISELTFLLTAAAAQPGSPLKGKERDVTALAFVLPNKRHLFFHRQKRRGKGLAGSAVLLYA